MGNNEWKLIQEGQFEEACRAADDAFNAGGGSAALRHKVFALFHMRRFGEARTICKDLILQNSGRVVDDFIAEGAANLLDGRPAEALASWQRGWLAPYQDGAGGITIRLLSFYMGVRLRDNHVKKAAINSVDLLCRNVRATNWPGPLGQLALGTISSETLMQHTTGPLSARRRCQAYFWRGVRNLANGEDGVSDMMSLSCSCGPMSYLEYEYYLAKGELSELIL
jgi:hypothetical protein